MNPLLADYAEHLWSLSPGMRSVFNEWVPRLHAAFGTHHHPRHPSLLGTPDGVDGLSRAGSWERLLVSEWALAQEVPEEFIRRAAMREQLFLQLARVKPTVAPETRVWLDCGPRQIGAPRLAHLALLVVLRRRAMEAGGEFFWATTCMPEDFRSTVDPKALLRIRTSALLSPDLAGPGDRFVVGAACPGAQHISVDEVEGGLQVRLGRAAVFLALPPVTKVLQLLKHPVGDHSGPRVTRPTTGSRVDAIRFNRGGGVLFVVKNERAEAWAVPRGPRQRARRKAAEPWFGHGDGHLIAVGWRHRAMCTLRIIDGEFVYRGRREARMPVPPDFDGEGPLRRFVEVRAEFDAAHLGLDIGLFVRDGQGMLFFLEFGHERALPVERAQHDPVRVEGVLVWINEAGERARLLEIDNLRITPEFRARILREPLEAQGWLMVCPREHGVPMAFSRGEGTWWMHNLSGWGREPRFLPDEAERHDLVDEVVGVLAKRDGRDTQRALLVHFGDQRLLSFGSQMPRMSVDFPAGIDHVTAGGKGATVAAVATKDGRIHFLSMEGQILLSFLPENR